MVLVMAGTGDGRELARQLRDTGLPCLVTTVTEHGAARCRSLGLPARAGPLDEEGLAALLQAEGCRCLVDATHPFARLASETAMRATARCGAVYLRYERPPALLPPSPLIHPVPGFEDAAEGCRRLGGPVFLAVGVKELSRFAALPAEGIPVICRVLPRPESLAACRRLGIPPSRIVPLEGPPSVNGHRALFRRFGVRTLVTRESGATGGVREKVAAALAEGVRVVLVQRPSLAYPERYSHFTPLIRRVLALYGGAGMPTAKLQDR